MIDISEIIASGQLELYVLGETSREESDQIQHWAETYPEIKTELESIELSLEQYALKHAVEPPATVKPFLMAVIDFTERMKNGEVPANPPVLNDQSKISDYKEWLERKDLQCETTFGDIYAKIVSYTSELLTAIVWLRDMAPGEIHDDEYERFLVVEGSCTITIESEEHNLNPGDYLSIPLFADHNVKVTSPTPCKVILQRVKVAA